MELHAKIKQYLLSHGISQAFVAEKTGITRNRLSQCLNGGLRMSAEEFVAIVSLLEIDFKSLVNQDDQ